MDKQKFVARVNNMIYSTCGCNLIEGIEVLKECLKLSKNCKKFPEDILIKPNAKELKFVKYWADCVRVHSDKEWSKQQNIIINSQIQNSRSIKWTNEQFESLKKLKIRQ